jgi:hypothetical protein
MPKPTRDTVHARQNLVARITAEFQPIESNAEAVVLTTTQFIGSLMAHRHAAALHPTAGSDVIELMRDASFFAIEARAKIMQAHERLAQLPVELGIVGFAPECPDNTTGIVQIPILGIVR